jgi:glycosyltransferase involved in cell wall biosynthesis
VTKKKLKIAIFHLGFFFSGGGERLVIEEALGLSKKGHKVVLFAPVIDKKRCFPQLIKKVNIKPLFLQFPFKFPLRDFLLITGSVMLAPLTFWRFRNFDVFFGANQPGPLICYFLSKILKKPYAIYLAQPTRLIYPRKVDKLYGFGKGSFSALFILGKIFMPAVKYLDKISIEGADVVLANGKYIAGVLKKYYDVEPIVCPAGCFPKKKIVKYQRRWKGKINLNGKTIKKPFLLVTNRHFPQKRFDYAINTLNKVKTKFPKLSLIITGRCTKHTLSLKKMVKKMGLKNKVYFAGLVKERVLNNLYANTVLYLYTSPQEDFGMGIIEAMAAGAAVVAWNEGGPTNTVVNGETGYLAKSNNQKDFQNKIIALLKNKKIAELFAKAGWERSRLFSFKKHNHLLEKRLLRIAKNL